MLPTSGTRLCTGMSTLWPLPGPLIHLPKQEQSFPLGFSSSLTQALRDKQHLTQMADVIVNLMPPVQGGRSLAEQRWRWWLGEGSGR